MYLPKNPNDLGNHQQHYKWEKQHKGKQGTRGEKIIVLYFLEKLEKKNEYSFFFFRNIKFSPPPNIIKENG